MAAVGLEPTHLSAQDPKSCVSANFTKRPMRTLLEYRLAGLSAIALALPFSSVGQASCLLITGWKPVLRTAQKAGRFAAASVFPGKEVSTCNGFAVQNGR